MNKVNPFHLDLRIKINKRSSSNALGKATQYIHKINNVASEVKDYQVIGECKNNTSLVLKYKFHNKTQMWRWGQLQITRKPKAIIYVLKKGKKKNKKLPEDKSV